ncbi:MAG: hypothetical protein A2X13_05845 [Bacteroidetes bacterium GWC2_33_15]|nr:MAG: hypothetical protein A2X10_00530 [Bacteroidetes bacterium GWA2_33_15]OFX52012.1 MAG: hypothetical protein A2X13_05845 [Bacteroidetes bacterium GWC2_33_15]OFX63842.1 MAG: hypothetical protein A2X15_00770 [Bacteroidetes bacterium GWB2_32_14]OFX67415.1 MAG: hypothetical protein A2X14_12575 [Bacteroidetes bacterium GWD2_33_33]HAN17820.1 hypothetical protein [Bacteroidales bacterium]
MLKINQRLENPIYHGAKAKTLGKAHDLRMCMTSSERILWQNLRNKKVLDYKFRRQHAISQFIADFYCHEARSVIEVDGGYHNNPDQQEYDKGRTAELENLGIKVLRFTNKDVETDINKVITEISTYLKHFTPPKSSPKGRT